MKTLAYFDIFNYPLTGEEIALFLPEINIQSLIDTSLENLLEDKLIFKVGDFYSLKNRQSLSNKRIEGNIRASRQLKRAKRIAKLLSCFPFVESISISGSLSKNFADQKSDIDFFIITKSDRLWIARTLMHLFKKLSYLIGKQHWFCMNYYIDEKEMEIIEKNIFTAMEIVTLKPMQGGDCFKRFINANSWTTNYFPEQKIFFPEKDHFKRIFIRRWIEKIFSSNFGDIVENWLMNLTDQRWKKKTRQNRSDDHGDRIAMLVSPHFSKPDPEIFQSKVIKEYELRIHQLLNSNQLLEIEL